MDYTLYWWHVCTHRIKFLWRFHLPHHADLDMDASTALRFHFGEVAISVVWRALQVVLIGVSPLAFSVWQTGLVVAILFHHSNIRLAPETERRLSRWLVTPGMHAIHHSAVEDETNSNWSSGLAIWDRLHGTYRLDVPQPEITIGVPAYRDPKELTLRKVLKMPFAARRYDWRLPDGRLRLTRGED
jgi:sterol desaturase/sphingolipid hydroxylase (fatty acid hydroxylase superfamily)